MTPAGFWIRVLANIIDMVLFTILRWALNFVFTLLGITRETSEVEKTFLKDLANQGADPGQVLGASLRIAHEGGAFISFGVFFLLSLVIVLCFITWKGGTPGKLALGLSIRGVHDQNYPPFWRAFIREVVGKYFLWPLTLGIGALMIVFHGKKRGLHDIAAGTVVIKLET